MGWLRDSMRQSRSPHRSFGAVARAALGHPAWPKDSKAQARSLASLFSKLDRGIDLQWLADRPAVQQVLADVLGSPHSKIAEVAGGVLAQSPDFLRRIRFDDLPYASALDLTEEPLPPGIPDAVLRPASWQRLWWVAPSGSGRSLAGAWLAARRLANFVVSPTFGATSAAIPRDRPCFVELWSPDAERALKPTGDAPLCIAAPFAPDERTADWTVVRSPDMAAVVGPLVRWAALRLPRDGHFVPSLAEEWLEAAAVRGDVDGLGAAIGFLGVIDQYGAPELARRGISSMGDRFVRDRLAELSRSGVVDAAWLTEAAPHILAGLMRRLLTGSRSWDEPRTLDDWVELIPAEYQNTLDAEWLRGSVARAKHPPTVQELDRMLQDLAPGPERVARALEQAGLLKSKHGSDLLALGPRWLARHLAEVAKGKIAEGVPAEWSEALLAPHAAAPTARALFRRVTSGDLSFLEDALEQVDERDPVTVAALEAAFRAAGLATLSGLEVPEDVALALWDQQMALVVELEDGPHPRLGYGSFALGEPLLDVGTFRLAAIALSESLPPQRGLPHPVLRPFTATSPGPVSSALDSIWNVVRGLDPHATAWARAAYALATRVRSALAENAEREALSGPPPRRTTPPAPPPHVLEWPDRVLAAIAEGTLDFEDVADAPAELVAALFAMAAHQGTDLRRVAAAVWEAWARDPRPLHDTSLLSPSGPHWRRFYSSAPAAALEVLFARGLVTRETVPYALFDETAWRGILSARPDAVSGVPAAWAAMSPAILREALRSTTPTEDDLRRAWERAPEVVMAAVDDAMDRDDPFAANLLAAAPGARTAEIVRRVSARLLGATWLRRRQTAEARKWLAERVAERSDGWREAYDLLAELGSAN